MKGLLLKDWYLMKKTCRTYLLVTAVFIAAYLFSGENTFFLFYPCILGGMLPVTLLGYDERSHWLSYCDTLPYTRAQIVSGKYLIGLISQAAIMLVTGIVQALRTGADGNFVLRELLTVLLLMMAISALSAAISLPFIFKLGVEKGRAAYYVMIGFVCAASVLATRFFKAQPRADAPLGVLLAVLVLVALALYALSWYLSVVFYQKRELP